MDVLRWLVILEAVFLAGWAIAVLHEARRFRAPNIYTRLVAASYIALVALEAIRAWLGPRRSHDHRLALLLLSVIALTYGLGAMATMFHYYSYAERVKRHGAKSAEAAAAMKAAAGVEDD